MDVAPKQAYKTNKIFIYDLLPVKTCYNVFIVYVSL